MLENNYKAVPVCGHDPLRVVLSAHGQSTLTTDCSSVSQAHSDQHSELIQLTDAGTILFHADHSAMPGTNNLTRIAADRIWPVVGLKHSHHRGTEIFAFPQRCLDPRQHLSILADAKVPRRSLP
ncbi:MAG: hypothetical protein IPI44_18905 [Sulfuritalea sp.]|nr:hypothetical protein [Sulfuritalea sp.]